MRREFPTIFVDSVVGITYLVVHKDSPGMKEFALKVHMGVIKPFEWSMEFPKEHIIHPRDPNALLIPIQKDGQATEIQVDTDGDLIFVAHGIPNWRKRRDC